MYCTLSNMTPAPRITPLIESKQKASIVSAAETSPIPIATDTAVLFSRWLLVVPLVLFGFLTFVYGLERVPLWGDEGWTVAATDPGVSLVETVTDWVAVDVHPPLYFLQLNLWRDFTGDSIFAMRYLAVLVSVLGVALAYRVGRSLFSHQAGMLAALLFTLHDLVQVLAQEVRHYPQPVVLVLLVTWLYWRMWRRPSARRGVPLALTGAALLYTHYWGGFILLGLFVHALLTRWRQIRTYFFTFAGMGLLFAPWLPFLYDQITLERPGGLPHALENSQAVYAVLTYQLLGIPELLWALLLVAGGLNVLARRDEEYSGNRWLKPTAASVLPLLVVGLAVGLTLAINPLYPTLSFRAMSVIVPLVIVGAAYALSQFGRRELAVMTVFVVGYGLTTTSAGPQLRGPWLEMAEFTAAHSTDADAALIEISGPEYALTTYLERYPHAPPHVQTKTVRINEGNAAYRALLDEVTATHDGMWIANLGWVEYDIRADLTARGFVQSAPEIDLGLFAGEPTMLWRMDRTPDGDLLGTYSDDSGDALSLLRGDAVARGDSVTVTLLWSADETPARDYTVSAFMLGPDGAFANHDAAPLDGRSPTSTWQPDTPVFDAHTIDASNLPSGEYRVGVQVYTFTDQTFSEIENLTLDTCDDDPDCRFLIVDAITLE